MAEQARNHRQRQQCRRGSRPGLFVAPACVAGPNTPVRRRRSPLNRPPRGHVQTQRRLDRRRRNRRALARQPAAGYGDRSPLEAFDRPFADVAAMNAHLLRTWR